MKMTQIQLLYGYIIARKARPRLTILISKLISDIDECKLGIHCKHGKCKNTVGKYSCICDKYKGFRFDGTECIKDTQRILIYTLSGNNPYMLLLYLHLNSSYYVKDLFFKAQRNQFVF